MIEMETSSEVVELQPSVQDLINKICAEKCVSPPDVSARLKLSQVTEAAAVDILNTIYRSTKTIPTFSGFIIHLIKNQNSPPLTSTQNLPLKRSSPTSFDAGTPTKSQCIHHVSPNSTQCAVSPCSSFMSRTIPEYFLPGTPNDGYGSVVSKQTTSFPCLDSKNANSNTVTCYQGESIKSSFRIQKQLNFSPGCRTDDGNGNHSRSRQPVFGTSKVSHQFSTLQNQLMLTPCSISKDTSPKHFSDLSSATHNDCRIQLQDALSPSESLGGAICGDIEPHFGSITPIHLDGTHSVAMSHQALSTLAPTSSSKDASPTHFSNIYGATRKDSQIDLQHTLPPTDSLEGATRGNIEPQIGPMAPTLSDVTLSHLKTSHQRYLLAELEFRKMFMVYSYVGRNKLEDVISVYDAIEIRDSMINMPMYNFEAIIWAKYGQKCCEPSDRAMHYDWDSGKTYLYYCFVSADGTCQFKGPYLNTRRTHLQRELGDDNVLIVQFIDDQETSDMPSNHCNWSAAYQRIAEGITVGLRIYCLFAFKDVRADKNNLKAQSTKKLRSSWAVKCYFIRNGSDAPWMETDSCILLKKTIHEARCLFMHVHTVTSMAKYISRCSLALSNTIKLHVDLASVHVERIEDIPCRDDNGDVVINESREPLIHTDGTGFISEDLALLCAKDFTKAEGTKDENFELEEESQGLKSKEFCMGEPPLLVQCRLFKEGYAVKGTLLVNKKLKARTIQIRPSMIKVEKDTSLSGSTPFSSLEINSISRQPRKANLSKNLIALLTVGGVPEDYFFSLLDKALEDAQKVSTKDRAAIRVALKYRQMDDSSTSVAMIGSGIPIDEPYLQYRLSILANEELKGLRGGKIPINESFYLIGTADPTGTLNSDEVCVILESGPISGPVLVYRNPGIHFGDIHILNAKYVKELEEYVGNAKYGIFFSTKGRRSVGSEIANGDFDGDIYWVSRSPQLLQYFKVSKPWERINSTPSAPSKKPSEFSYDDLETELCTLLFATQKQSIVAGKAADSWLTFMDQYLTLGEDDADEKNRLKEKMLKLVDLYYDALDAPKSGKMVDIPTSLLPPKYPHFLEKKSKTFQSSSVLGKIYDKVKAYRPDNASIQGIPKHPIFNVDIPDASLNLWKDRYNSYKREMVEALQCGDESKNDSANMVIKRYKQMLYESESFATSARNIDDIYNESLAIYHASYNQAQKYGDVKKCGFAWKVAGEALCSFNAMKISEKSIPFNLNVLSKLF